MQYQLAEREARSYIYDLMNEAKEHGFKAEDKWTLCLVTKSTQEQISKDYYPTVVNEVSPEILFKTVSPGQIRSAAIPEQRRTINRYKKYH